MNDSPVNGRASATTPRGSPLASGVIGAAAGLVATGAMTLVMQRLHRRLPAAERHPLPPRLVTDRILGSGLNGVPDRTRADIAMAAHYGYGAVAGALYPVLTDRWQPHTLARTLADGAAFGVAVWAGSYLGWIPATGVLTPATRHPARRNAMMIAAHLVWGGATALLYEQFRRPAGFTDRTGAAAYPEYPVGTAGGAAAEPVRKRNPDRRSSDETPDSPARAAARPPQIS